ncbi:hypothetical protein CXG81DRAFT_24586 [Caulochytrium protostelioides]|uniref:Uncharacterized protein n=1 Tax=Caulochytrium protostelioides TaxID=1555241 RepID=A0A4V1IV47_9FUNG|nr:hypothetical protein CXG81DRAFT_24586 [Caulochytrium protostelioides]|eukprot:RKP02799.1 hypothetical protein CXG81DRAFT_24586 [Caulochytrium protostelioides]
MSQTTLHRSTLPPRRSNALPALRAAPARGADAPSGAGSKRASTLRDSRELRDSRGSLGRAPSAAGGRQARRGAGLNAAAWDAADPVALLTNDTVQRLRQRLDALKHENTALAAEVKTLRVVTGRQERALTRDARAHEALPDVMQGLGAELRALRIEKRRHLASIMQLQVDLRVALEQKARAELRAEELARRVAELTTAPAPADDARGLAPSTAAAAKPRLKSAMKPGTAARAHAAAEAAAAAAAEAAEAASSAGAGARGPQRVPPIAARARTPSTSRIPAPVGARSPARRLETLADPVAAAPTPAAAAAPAAVSAAASPTPSRRALSRADSPRPSTAARSEATSRGPYEDEEDAEDEAASARSDADVASGRSVRSAAPSVEAPPLWPASVLRAPSQNQLAADFTSAAPAAAATRHMPLSSGPFALSLGAAAATDLAPAVRADLSGVSRPVAADPLAAPPARPHHALSPFANLMGSAAPTAPADLPAAVVPAANADATWSRSVSPRPPVTDAGQALPFPAAAASAAPAAPTTTVPTAAMTPAPVPAFLASPAPGPSFSAAPTATAPAAGPSWLTSHFAKTAPRSGLTSTTALDDPFLSTGADTPPPAALAPPAAASAFAMSSTPSWLK